MLFHSVRSLSCRFRLLLCSLQQSDSLPFSDALTEEQIEAAFDEQEVPWRRDDEEVFTPAMTLWAFVGQALFKEEQRSCLAAAARIGVMLVAMGRPRCAQNNGPYCRARGRLPLAVIERLTLDVASRCEVQVPDKWLWKGRHVKLADGTSVSMPDTEAQTISASDDGAQRGAGAAPQRHRPVQEAEVTNEQEPKPVLPTTRTF